MSETSQALKNLRAFAIVMVICFHSVLAYLASQPAAPRPFDSPPYGWLATPILDNGRWLGFDLFAAFQYLSLMPMMFFLSGLFVWPSLRRKGSLTFIYARLLRIGLPFLLGAYLLMPLAYFPAYRVAALDPSWSAYLSHLRALPFWPSGPLWFLWELLLFDICAVVLYQIAPGAGDRLGRLGASAGERPERYFFVLLVISAIAYLPLAFVFGTAQWSMFGPFQLQPDRMLLYFVYFLAGLGIGARGYDCGLLRANGMLAQRWYIWLGCTTASFPAWMAAMAPSVYGYDNALLNLAAYLAVVAAVASTCFCFAGMFLRLATARWAMWDSLAENAYAIYLVHYVFVIWLQYALLDAALPTIVKATIVVGGTLGLSWSAAAALRRLPLSARLVRAKHLSSAQRVN